MREAVIHVPDEAFEAVGLEAPLAALRSAGLQACSELACESSGCILAVTVESRLPADALAGLDAVEWVERLREDGEGVVYLCKVDPEESRPLSGSVADHELSVDDDGLQVSLVGDQPALAGLLRAYEETGLDVGLERLADYRGPSDAMDSLTDRQREVLETAHDMGYFEVPKQASADEVAEAVELDPSTASEHLRRAERNLVGAVLDDQQDNAGT